MIAPDPFIVCIDESVNPTLTQRTPTQYTSPPQQHAQAAAPVELLTAQPCDDPGPWCVAVAGGSRTDTVEPRDAAAA